MYTIFHLNRTSFGQYLNAGIKVKDFVDVLYSQIGMGLVFGTGPGPNKMQWDTSLTPIFVLGSYIENNNVYILDYINDKFILAKLCY